MTPSGGPAAIRSRATPTWTGCPRWWRRSGPAAATKSRCRPAAPRRPATSAPSWKWATGRSTPTGPAGPGRRAPRTRKTGPAGRWASSGASGSTARSERGARSGRPSDDGRHQASGFDPGTDIVGHLLRQAARGPDPRAAPRRARRPLPDRARARRAAAWRRSTSPTTSGTAAASRSRCCAPSSPRSSAPSGSSPRSGPPPTSSTRTSCRSSTRARRTALLFYVMPFVEGESLRDRLAREQQLPVDDAVRIATRGRRARSTTPTAHGVIHRDIKPENILLHDGQRARRRLRHRAGASRRPAAAA